MVSVRNVGLHSINNALFGWRFLAMFTCGILDILYVTPWFEMSFAASYEDLKWIAIQSGTVAPEEFDPVMVETPAEPVVDTPAAE